MTIQPLSRDQVREVDQRAIDEFGLPGAVLMENAGRGCAELLISLGIRGPVLIFAGKGNNGGDGYVMARHLDNHGYQVRVLLFCEPAELKGDAAINFAVLEKISTVPIEQVADLSQLASLVKLIRPLDWIVDALLGTGTQGCIREPYLTAIRAINQAGVKVLSVDLPSGLDCDTGEPLGACVKAAHTATFVAPKLGFAATGAKEITGIVHVIDIGVPKSLLGK